MQLQIPGTGKTPSPSLISLPNTDPSLVEPAQYTMNISEAVPVGHRTPLPLAEDIDAPPFNVRRYELERLDSAVPNVPPFVNPRSTQTPFRLEVTWDSVIHSDSGAHDTVPYSPDDNRGNIVKLELLLVEPLDRESIASYQYRLLAIDGGSPSLTGTLMLEIRVVDANDHAPRFTKPVYEATVDEGVVGEKIIQLVADDADEGMNAVVRYDWPNVFNAATSPRSNSTLSVIQKEPVSRDELRSAPPSYWFNLDENTGVISVRRPLDYEVKSQHRFHVIAHNPKVTGDEMGRPGSTHQIMTSTASVVVDVRNMDDEPPQIVIDYVGGQNRNFKEIEENSQSRYFVAFVTVSDPDLGSELNKPSAHRGSLSDMGPFGDPVVSCSLGSHQDAYILEYQNRTVVNSAEKRYSLFTQRPLDREQSAIDRILIVCQDSGSPPRTATATAEVHVLDVNDCTPKIQVFSSFTTQVNRQEPLDPWPFPKLGQWIEKTRETNGQVHPTLNNAYLTHVPVFTVHIAENQPAGTIFARIWATDLDAGENGRVTYELPRVPLLVSITHSSTPVYTGLGAQQYEQVELSSSSIGLNLFRVDPTRGDVSTTKVIDREEGDTVLEQIFLVVRAKDHGDPPRSALILLHILIDDENDNPPVFFESKMHFSIRENLPAPATVGEVRIIDPDLRPIGTTFDSDPLSYGSPGPFYPGRVDYAVLRPHSPMHRKNSLHVRIDPSHNRRDLPFILFPTAEGRFFLNTTRALDRESEEAFQFMLIAVDGEDVLHSTHTTSDRLDMTGTRKIKHRTATASVLVTVLDENDNHPEIIFPNPSASNSTVHRVSFREPAGYEIVNINANDRDAGEANGKFYFELLPRSRSEDLFSIDRITGLLRTRRRMTKEDLGEYTLHVVVRDQGDPPLETQLALRLIVDQSEPHWPYSVRSNLNYFGTRSAASRSSGTVNGAGADYLAKETDSITPDGMYPVDGDHLIGPGELKRPLHADIILFVIVALILGLIIVMFGLCLYLRHKKNLFMFLPDLCVFCADGTRGSRGLDPKTNYTKTYADLEHRSAAHLNSTTDGNSPGLLANLLCEDNVIGKKLLPFNSTSPLQSPIPSSRGHPSSHFPTTMHGPYAQSHSRSSFNLNSRYGNYPGCSKDSIAPGVCPVVDGVPVRSGLAFSPTMIGSEGLFCPSANSVYRPGTTMGVNIPDVANQAETMRKHYGGYSRTSHPGVEYGPERTVDPSEFASSVNGPSNTYNVGHYMRHHPGPVYGPSDDTGTVFATTNSFEQFSRLGFPVIDEDVNPYQCITSDHYLQNQGVGLVSNPMSSKHIQSGQTRCKTGRSSNGITSKAITVASSGQISSPCDLVGQHQRKRNMNGSGVWKNQLIQWRSDPSLNHFDVMCPIAPYALRSEHQSTYEFNNTIHANATPRRLLKRSSSNKHTHGRGVNGYYSTLHESIKQPGSPKMMLVDFSGSKLASEETTKHGGNYAVSFPKLQASFV
ncbi:hypothetical protein FBUS_01476 [Fasciolopsis buskii]|uniref:Cadherin domain-containing protein n=1 Tax=Fasciolopsis buskii TaxID=27845 RepID=A0A8E0RRL8_9TREM|nr:hypothetical protein FBUS_01476 [Fasciolopsis buski]